LKLIILKKLRTASLNSELTGFYKKKCMLLLSSANHKNKPDLDWYNDF